MAEDKIEEVICERKFDGDIIITDPCYIIRRDEGLTDNDWDACEYGECMEALGIKHYMTTSTLCGDWECSTFNIDTFEKIGEFCADAGLVSVLLLDEVLAYNPKFILNVENEWTTTLIKNFKGTVQFVKITDDDDVYVQVVGHGVNRYSGRAINFIGFEFII